MRGPVVRLMLVALLALGAVRNANAQQPTGGQSRATRQLALPEASRALDYRPERNAPELQGLQARAGGSWAMTRNPETGTAHTVLGSGYFLSEARNATPRALEQVARRFVDENPALFGVSSRDLEVLHIRSQAGKTSVLFQQKYRGIPVWDARVHVVFHENGRLIAFGSDARRIQSLNVTPTLNRGSAFGRAREWAGTAGRGRDVSADLWIVPTGGQYRLAWRTIGNEGEEEPARVSMIDARDGTVLSSEVASFETNVTGTVTGPAHYWNPCDATSTSPYTDQLVSLAGAGSGSTDASGAFSITHGGTSPLNATVHMAGLYADVSNSNGSNAVITQQVTPGTPASIVWSDANSTAGERDVYVHINLARSLLNGIDPTFIGAEFDFPLVAHANDNFVGAVFGTSIWNTFNAFWTWNGTDENLWFCRSGTHAGINFQNSGQMAEVVYHEFGHSLTSHVYGGPTAPWPNSSIHEGNSDVLALLATQSPLTARGWNTADCNSYLRTADNTLRYPEDYGPYGADPHVNGQIISGVFWDAYEYLVAHGSSGSAARDIVLNFWHDGRMLGTPLNFPDQLYWTYIADDNDGNLANGTPHSSAIDAGGTAHGFLSLASLITYSALFSDVTTSTLELPWAAGTAWGDYDGDGDFDLFVSYDGTTSGQTSKLLRNTSGSFSDVTPSALQLQSCTAAAWGDYDEDGDQDLAILRNSGGARLFRNGGGGSFTDVTPTDLAAVISLSTVGWVDYDLDGDLDLSVGSELLRNNGGSSFTKMTGLALSGLTSVQGMAWTDYDRDGDSDVFFARYGANSLLVRNNGNGTFTDVTPSTLQIQCYSAAWGDYDNDGDPDLVTSSIAAGSSTRLFRYNSGTSFTEISDSDFTGRQGWSVEWGDYDNDGKLDVFVAGAKTDFLIHNDGSSTFSDRSARPVANNAFGSSAGWADYDGDGDLDIYLANYPGIDNAWGTIGPTYTITNLQDSGCRLFRNENATGNAWLHVDLCGAESNNDGVGARIKLITNAGTFYRQGDGGGGHATQNSRRIEFGLGSATSITSIKVTWPSGRQSTSTEIDLNSVFSICEPTEDEPEPEDGLRADLPPTEAGATFSTVLLGGSPNPFHDETAIRFSLRSEASPSLDVFDLVGRRVRSAGLGTLPGGPHRWGWDGRDDQGQGVPSGIYYVRFRTPEYVKTTRILKLR